MKRSSLAKLTCRSMRSTYSTWWSLDQPPISSFEEVQYGHHPASVKRGIVQGFVNRAIKVCSDEESKKVEIEHIMGEMQGNGYPKKFFQKAETN